jgi:hypothetical protein
LDIRENSFLEWMLFRFETKFSQILTTVHDPLLKSVCFLVANIHISHSYFVCKEKRRFEIYSLSIFYRSTSLHSSRFLLAIAIEAHLTFFLVTEWHLCYFLHFSSEKKKRQELIRKRMIWWDILNTESSSYICHFCCLYT